MDQVSNSKKWLICNWKMHVNLPECEQFVQELSKVYPQTLGMFNIIIAPQFPLIKYLKDLATSLMIKIDVAAQNCSTQLQGAYTGEVSIDALASVGCRYVLLGHSERRHLFKENSLDVAKKVGLALQKGVIPIVCIGEISREKNRAYQEVKEQILPVLDRISQDVKSSVLWAYEPVWAIGAKEPAELTHVVDMHQYIKQLIHDRFSQWPIVMYGGAINPQNANYFLDNQIVDGLLLGRASLTVASFLRIIGIEV